MGNSQSNQEKDWKIFKIANIDHRDDETCDYIRFYLDDYVEYKDGRYKRLDLDKKVSGDFLCLLSGDYLRVDLNRTKLEVRNHTFCDSKVIERVWEQVVERIDSNGNIFYTTLEFLNEVAETRTGYQIAAIESRGSNYARLRQTSYDMPPKW
ncbi:MAG: hypothetical protein MRERC_1c034 [Mycoplasmataceae bacterium RC_NB112A]|nr:MAG: hypothetical protein MRERC_10c019 [Mycoplasmataceae bacterium RC_NB112A]KLL01955.1 MAG: hypothetical protein MRERC_6c043 [Mycoplasmataceae bacterium RC_NB112A]KLL02453.1 MAG: hypothetical protein MRERC_1c034 [Mycoplasmataceae bacterium RC_NB112A]